MKLCYRLFVFIVLFTLMTSTVAHAAFSDVDIYENEINTLQAMGIINGFEDGTFRGDKYITRAEFCVMLYNTKYDDTPGLSSDAPVYYNDVNADFWGYPYITIFTAQDILNGYPNGSFKPDKYMTYSELLTACVRDLYYAPIALLYGGNPEDYVQVAENIDIALEDIVDINAPCTRYTAASVIFKFMNARINETSMENGYYIEADDTPFNTLLDYKGIKKIENGYVVDSHTVKGTYKIPYRRGKVTEEITLSDNLEEYIGKTMTLFVKDDKLIYAYE